jgi:hypothetical protein
LGTSKTIKWIRMGRERGKEERSRVEDEGLTKGGDISTGGRSS